MASLRTLINILHRVFKEFHRETYLVYMIFFHAYTMYMIIFYTYHTHKLIEFAKNLEK
jgi:hypothetical protein